ncbi:hypothetical protein Tco_0543763 [Tanacetum coccineum]
MSIPKPKEDPKPNPHQPSIPYPSWFKEENFHALENPTGLADHFVYRIDIDNDLLLEETDAFRALDSIPPYINDGIYDSEGDILFLEGLLNDEIPRDLPPLELNNDPKGDILYVQASHQSID